MPTLNPSENGELPGIATIRAALADAQPVVAAAEVDEFQLRLAHFAQNDFGNGQRLRARYGRDMLYVKNIGWHVWVGSHWSLPDGERLSVVWAQETATAIQDEARHLKAQLLAGETYVMDKRTGEDKRVGRLWAWAVKSGDMIKSRAMLDAAQPYLTVDVDELDADPFLFNAANGTLHLRAQGADGSFVVLKKHSRKDRITKLSPAKYDEEAASPVFDGFLQSIFPNADGVAAFLQTYFGYCLSADVSERKMVMALGVGSNGKSTLVGAVADVIGQYAMSLPVASLMLNDRGSKGGGDASPDLARLPGARLVTCSEPEGNAKFSEGIIKQMTGGTDMMTVRHLNKGFFDFLPTHKLFISMNKKPQIRGQDDGIWDRIALVPFGVRFTKEQKDVTLPERLKAERSGILNWLVDGFRVWNERRLQMPDAVIAATEEYRSESDKVGQFLGAAIVRREGVNVTAKRLYTAFLAWCKLNAEDPISNTAFGRAMTERGFHKEKVGIVYYANVDLIEDFAGQTDIEKAPQNEDAR